MGEELHRHQIAHRVAMEIARRRVDFLEDEAATARTAEGCVRISTEAVKLQTAVENEWDRAGCVSAPSVPCEVCPMIYGATP